MYNKDLSNYASIDQSTLLNGRELEAYVLTKSANKLRACKNNWDDKEKLIEVLEYNQKIWIIFQDHISSDECELPMEIRLNILQLIKFMDTRTYKIMSKEMSDSSSLDIIIEINNGIAQGLRTKKEEEE